MNVKARRGQRSSSPPRPHLTALSPLQAFSPLEAEGDAMSRSPPASSGHTTPNSNTPATPTGGRSPSSLRRSLSSRERVFSYAERQATSPAKWEAASVTTRLILVKAPTEEAEVPLPQRSRSSSNLVPVADSGDKSATAARGHRPSFAAASFSSFAPITPITPQESMHASSSSVDLPRRLSIPAASLPMSESFKSLSPEEVLDLAKGLLSPVVAQPGTTNLQRRRSTSGLPVSDAKKEAEKQPIELEPVDYTEMDEDVLLPFSDRPSQVKDVLCHPANEALLTQLKIAFPVADTAREQWKDIDVLQWTWPEFEKHLTEVTRQECPDYPWVVLARSAVREHNVALWEKLGVCLGCDAEVMLAGDEDEEDEDALTLDESEYLDPSSRVFIQPLEPVDPFADEKAERDLFLEFDKDDIPDLDEADLVPTVPGLGMAPIGEHEDEAAHAPKPSAGNREVVDYFASPDRKRTHSRTSSAQSHTTSVFASSVETSSGAAQSKVQRTKSFVGLQICTSPMTSTAGMFDADMTDSPSSLRSPMEANKHQREPGNPMFVTSFNTLSIAPNLGRKASMSSSGVPSHHTQFTGGGVHIPTSRNIGRKPSGAGLSESAITFVSDSSLG